MTSIPLQSKAVVMAQNPQSQRDELLQNAISDLSAVLEALKGQIGSTATWATVGDASYNRDQAKEMADRILQRGEYSRS